MFIKLSVQKFQPLILIYRRGDFVCRIEDVHQFIGHCLIPSNCHTLCIPVTMNNERGKSKFINHSGKNLHTYTSKNSKLGKMHLLYSISQGSKGIRQWSINCWSINLHLLYNTISSWNVWTQNLMNQTIKIQQSW